MDVVSIGEVVIDFLPGKEKNSYIANPGGAPANAAIAMARNKLSAGFIGKVGRDSFGSLLIETLEKDGVKILNDIFTDDAVTTLVFVHLDEKNERSFSFVRKPGADMFLNDNDVRAELLEEAKIIHAGSCSLSAEPAAAATKKALLTGHTAGKMVSFDLNYRNMMWDDRIEDAMSAVHEVLPYIDLLKISDEERMVYKQFDSVHTFMQHFNISLLIETLGEGGSLCYFKDEKIFMPVYSSDCVDTTGAGDAFWGAFLSTLLLEGVNTIGDIKKELILKAMKYGNVAGGLCVRQKGAISSLPGRDELDEAVENFDIQGVTCD